MAAGVSSRMKKALEQGDSDISIDPKLIEESNNLPKCMLSVGPNGTKFIDYIIWNAVKWGFEEIIVLLNPNDLVTKKYVKKFVEVMKLKVLVHFAIQFIPLGREKPWGTGDAVLQALNQFPLKMGEMYSISNSDNLCSREVFRSAYLAQENTIYSYDTASLGINPADRVKFWLVVTNDITKKMTNIVEKPNLDEIIMLELEHTLSVNINILTLSYSDTIFKLKNLEPNPIRNEKEVTDIFRLLAIEWRLKSQIIHESLPDLTSKSDIPKVQKYLAEKYPELQNYT